MGRRPCRGGRRNRSTPRRDPRQGPRARPPHGAFHADDRRPSRDVVGSRAGPRACVADVVDAPQGARFLSTGTFRTPCHRWAERTPDEEQSLAPPRKRVALGRSAQLDPAALNATRNAPEGAAFAACPASAQACTSTRLRKRGQRASRSRLWYSCLLPMQSAGSSELCSSSASVPKRRCQLIPVRIRQAFNDSEQLWLIVGAPSEAASTLEMTAETPRVRRAGLSRHERARPLHELRRRVTLTARCPS